jgi:hypothetical protein
MDFLSELLGSFLGGDVIKALAKKTGIKASDLKKFVSQALPYLLENLTKNASSEEGASSLLAALMEHTDSRTVDKQIADADIVDGAKIIGHILGTNESKDLKDLSKQSKLSETAVSGILSSIAPALLTYLSSAVFGAKKTSSRKKSWFSGLLGGLFGHKSSTGRRRTKSKSDDEFNVVSLLSALLSKK